VGEYTCDTLAHVFMMCFPDHIGTDKEKLLFEEAYILKTLRKHLDKKSFKGFMDNESIWHDAWASYGCRTQYKIKEVMK